MIFRCRTCYNLIEENQGLDLFAEGSSLTEQGHKSLAAMLLECTSVNVLEGGEFQHIRERRYIICRPCQLQLIKLYDFRNQCIRVQNLFKNTKSNTDNTSDVGNHNHSAIFLIDTDEFNDENVNCESEENIYCEGNKENFNENRIHDDNFLVNDENDEEDDDENCSNNSKDETGKIYDRLKFCAKISGMKEEEILSIIDSETPAVGELVKKKRKTMPKVEIDNKEKLEQEKKERYKNLKVYKRDSTNVSKTQNKDTVCYKIKTTLQENYELSKLSTQKEEEINKEISEYLSKKEKLFPTSTTECDVNLKLD